MNQRFLRTLVLTALSATLIMGAATSAQAMHVSGQQKIVNEKAGKYRMTGDLIGKWRITEFEPVRTEPYFEATGEEKFNGCLDTDRNGSCAGEPSGVLRFKFRYWGQFDDSDNLQLGTCAHPVTKGKGELAGASGFLMMVDTPKKSKPYVTTRYEGVIDLGDRGRRAHARAMPSGC